MKKNTLNLSGKCKLYFYDANLAEADTPNDLLQMNEVECIDAVIPNNVELDLSKAGKLPEDLFFGDNIAEVQKYESFDFWYRIEFDFEKQADKKYSVVFDRVYCVAEYFLNGKKIGFSEDAFVEHVFDVSDALKDGKNVLYIKLASLLRHAAKVASEDSLVNVQTFVINAEAAYLRMPPHCFGWDIMPRALSRGIIGGIEIRERKPIELTYAYLATCLVTEDLHGARLYFSYGCNLSTSLYGKLFIDVKGECGNSAFRYRSPIRFVKGVDNIVVDEELKLWNPVNSGEQNLYRVTVSIRDDAGKIYDERVFDFGIRQIEVVTPEEFNEKTSFLFKVNHKPLFVSGTNWVGLSPFHAQDREKMPRALELLKESGSNMVRCWGGNLYESDEFFDFCDKNGILVWQDFGMACSAYPQTERFFGLMEDEVKKVAERLRNHCSLAVYCGDNECDAFLVDKFLRPTENKITREVIPNALYKYDCMRKFIPSSPYISPKNAAVRNDRILPEQHLWGDRGYFKSDFYKTEQVNFVGEIGHAGSPSMESIRKFIDHPSFDHGKFGKEYLLHVVNSYSFGKSAGYEFHLDFMRKQAKLYFNENFSDHNEFIVATQIVQAEAFKFFIEWTRQKKWNRRTGILWWNLLEGWPQLSNSVVDFYGKKKLAFHYIKNSQCALQMIAKEPVDGVCEIIVDNNTVKDRSGSYEIYDGTDGTLLKKGEFFVEEGKAAILCRIDVTVKENTFLTMRLYSDGKITHNHYAYAPGQGKMDYRQYLRFFKNYAEQADIENPF